MKTYEHQLNHLIQLSKNNAWKNYAWYRAKELDKDESGNWRGIAKDLEAAMRKWNEERQNFGK